MYGGDPGSYGYSYLPVLTLEVETDLGSGLHHELAPLWGLMLVEPNVEYRYDDGGDRTAKSVEDGGGDRADVRAVLVHVDREVLPADFVDVSTQCRRIGQATPIMGTLRPFTSTNTSQDQ